MARPSTQAVRLLSGEREPVLVATTGNITLSGLQTIDGVTLTAGARVLVKNQTDATQNGIYDANVGTWYRAADARSSRSLNKGVKIGVQSGTVNAGSVYVCATLNPDIGDDDIEFSLFLLASTIEDIEDAIEDLIEQAQAAADAAIGATGVADYSTRAAAQAATIPGAKNFIRVAGYSAAGDGGGAMYKRVVSAPANNAYLQSADGAYWELAEVYPSILQFGVVEGGSAANGAANTAKFQSAINAALAHQRALSIPTGVFIIDGTVTIAGALTLRGAGERVSFVRTNRLNSAAIRFQIDVTDAERFYVGDFSLEGYFEGGDTHTASIGIEIAGDTTAFFQHGTFGQMGIYGFHAAHYISKGAAETSPDFFENRFNWTRFDNITIGHFSKRCSYGWWFAAGSGTGNAWHNPQGSVDVAWIRAEGADCAVGDIVMTGGHLGGDGSTVVYLIGDDTKYRDNIISVGTQFDAGISGFIQLGSGAIFARNFRSVGNNVGGAVSIYDALGRPIHGSQIHDRDVGEWLAGQVFEDITTGAHTTTMFTVDLATYTGVCIDLVVSGLVQGVDSGVRSARYHVVRGSGNASVAVIGTPGVTVESGGAAPANFFALSTTVSGSTVAFKATFTASGSGSLLDAQIRAVGGKMRVKRG
jgi:hypothetical protein